MTRFMNQQLGLQHIQGENRWQLIQSILLHTVVYEVSFQGPEA